MTREEYIKNNKYLRKSMSNLSQADICYLKDIANGSINVDEKDLRLKQLLYHMINNLKPREMPGFIKAFKTLCTL